LSLQFVGGGGGMPEGGGGKCADGAAVLCGTTSENGPDMGTLWPLAYMHWT